jgi:Mg2+ and Co2+ transporter CorA
VNELTMQDLLDKLRELDELTILELLDVTSEELVMDLQDRIVEKFDQLVEYFGDDLDEEN